MNPPQSPTNSSPNGRRPDNGNGNGLKGWLKKNNTLAVFLAAQLTGVVAGGAWVVSYYVKMETRVHILETRGAPYTVGRLDQIDHNITVLEELTKKNGATLDRVVDVLTRELRNPAR